MATRFDSKEYAKQRLFSVCTKYFPMDHLKITAGRKGFRLGESTIMLIEKSRSIVTLAEESNMVLPTSTTNVFRYGVICQNIFDNLNKYQIISQLKSRSRRGYRKELEVIDFDLKKIELEFKKSPHPPVKSLKDGKFIKNAQKLYLKLLDDGDYRGILEDVVKKQELFIVENSDGGKFFSSLFRIINNLVDESKGKKRLEDEIIELQNQMVNIRNNQVEIKKKLPACRLQIEHHREKSGILEIIREKEQLYSDPELSIFLKALTTCLERYVKMIERREQRELEQKEAFLGLILEPTKFQGLDENLWRQIVFIIETHGFELLSGKTWFKFDDSTELRRFMVRKDILEKFAHLRSIEIKQDEIESQMKKNQEYREAENLIHDYEKNRSSYKKLEKKIPLIKKRIAAISEEMDSEKEKFLTFLS